MNHDTEFDRESEIPGFVVERRLFVGLAGAAAIMAALGAPLRALAASPEAAPLDWQAFLDEAAPAARRLLEAGASQDEYLERVAALAVRLRGVPDSKLYPFAPVAPEVSFGPSYTGGPFAVIQWRMLPNAVLPAHNHPNASVCTLGVEGECRIRNLEVVGEAPAFTSKAPFRVRVTRDEALAPGRVNTLSSTRDNIHWLVAGPKGARGVDIGTMHGKDVGFAFLDVGAEPVDAGRRVYEAVWR